MIPYDNSRYISTVNMIYKHTQESFPEILQEQYTIKIGLKNIKKSKLADVSTIVVT